MSWLIPPTRRSYPCRGDYLRILREKRGWTQEQFADVVGYSPRLIRKAEGSASLNPETIEDIADALSTSGEAVFPEDLVSDPVAAARLIVQSYDLHEHAMLNYCGHVFAEDFVYWCAGEETGFPFAGTFQGITGFQDWLDRFFSVITRPRPEPLAPTFALAENEVIARYQEVTALGGEIGPPVWIVNITKFQRGKVIRMENYFDTQTGQKVL
ncbi:MAG: helix-turn-helix transcriptional regulator, partial [Planctomycetaceae bacterium]|nr:helix-turn-helix transcriptional regulator [Planctomycetaceae bacterium]